MASQTANCDDCSKTFQSKAALSQHVAAVGHMPTKSCTACCKLFKTEQDLERHKKYSSAHSTRKPHKEDASARAVGNIAVASSKAGHLQGDRSTQKQKAAKMMGTRQTVPNVSSSNALVSSPHYQTPVKAERSLMLTHNANTYSIFTKAERRSLAADLVTRCHTVERLRGQGFCCPPSQDGGSRLPADLDLAKFLPLPSASAQNTKRKAIAIDCEMVGMADGRSELALLCAVDFLTGETLINSFVKPYEPVADWRTSVSGISPALMAIAEAKGQALAGWESARAKLFKHASADTIIVGHAVHYDLRVLRISHTKIVDSSILTGEAVYGMHKKFGRRLWGLKQLCQDFLGLSIQNRQNAGHDCLEDTLAAREIVLFCLRHPDRLKTWAKSAAKQASARRRETYRRAAKAPQPSWITRDEEGYDDDSTYMEILCWEDVADYLGLDVDYDPWSD